MRNETVNEHFVTRLGDLIDAKSHASHLPISSNTIAKEIGISPAALSQYKNGERMPGMESIIKIANYFNTSPNDLFGYADDESEDEKKAKVQTYTGLSNEAIKQVNRAKSNPIKMSILNFIIEHQDEFDDLFRYFSSSLYVDLLDDDIYGEWFDEKKLTPDTLKKRYFSDLLESLPGLRNHYRDIVTKNKLITKNIIRTLAMENIDIKVPFNIAYPYMSIPSAEDLEDFSVEDLDRRVREYEEALETSFNPHEHPAVVTDIPEIPYIDYEFEERLAKKEKRAREFLIDYEKYIGEQKSDNSSSERKES